jgi:DNA repair protein RecO (recombination protein O)
VAGYYKTEAIVLRSFRLREADRIVHLYTATHGRVGAVVKGVRRTKSRFGGRLEPFFRVRLVLYEGRGDLDTVTQAEAIEWYPRLRSRGASLNAAGTACETVHRLFGEQDANPAAYNLLCHELRLLDADGDAAGAANLLSFRLKLLLAAGFVPELGGCAACGSEHIAPDPQADRAVAGRLMFSAASGGVVCSDCSPAGGFPIDGAALSFMALALGAPLKEAPSAAPGTLAQVDRVVAETLAHHAQVRLRSVA